MSAIAPGALLPVHCPLASAVRRGTSYFLCATSTDVSVLVDADHLVQRLQCHDRPCALAFDRRTGLIAVATADNVLLFEELYDIATDEIRWKAAGSITLEDRAKIDSLSWGTSGELLISAASTLMLYGPAGRRSAATGGIEMLCTWRCAVGGKGVRATFSPDGNLVASFAADDRLVKVWRRLPDRTSSTVPGGRQSDFDFVYLKHPRAVTSVQWRTPAHEDLTVDNVLYTTARDAVVRVWASDIPHDSHLLTLHGQVALTEAGLQVNHSLSSSPVLSTSAPGTRSRRGSLSRRGGIGTSVAAIMDDEVFAAAVKSALSQFDEAACAGDAPRRQAAHRLKQQRTAQPELLLCIGLTGGIEAHALTHIGSRSHKPATQHLIFADDKDILRSLRLTSRIVSIAVDLLKLDRDGAKLCMLIRTTEAVHICELDLLNLFTQGRPHCLHPLATISGAAGPFGGVCAIEKTGSSSIDVRGDSGTVSWMITRDGRLARSQSTQTVAEESTTTRHLEDIRHELAAEIVDSMTIVIKATEQSVISCSDRPLHIHRFQSKVVTLDWRDSQSSPSLLVATEDGLLLVLHRTTSEDTGLPNWKVQWQTHLDILPTHVAFTEDGTVWVASREQLIAYSALERGVSSTADTPAMYSPATLYSLLSLGRLDAASAVLRELYDSLLNERDFQPDMMKVLAKGKDSEVDQESEIIDQSMADSLKQLLATSPPLGLSVTQLDSLADIIDAVASGQVEASNLDASGFLFYVFFVLSNMRAARTASSIVLDNAHVWFARQSETQESLLSLVRKPFGSTLTWAIARQLRLFDWVREDATLIQIGEDVARSEFLHGGLPDEMDPSPTDVAPQPAAFIPGATTGERDPVSAALWYWTLRRPAQVTSCWRLASSHRERTQTMRLLTSNDFAQPKARTTAAKNAYALLGRRRPRYAAAWFILANSPSDALQILHHRARDPPLARAIAKLFAISATTTNPAAPTLLQAVSEDDRAVAQAALSSFVEGTLLPWSTKCNDRFGACIAAALVHEAIDRQLALLVLPLPPATPSDTDTTCVVERPAARWTAVRTLLAAATPNSLRFRDRDTLDKVLTTLPHLRRYAAGSLGPELRPCISDDGWEERAISKLIPADDVHDRNEAERREETGVQKDKQGIGRLQQTHAPTQATFQMEPDMDSFSSFDF